MRMWQGAVGVAPVDGLVSPAYVVARPLPEIGSRYYECLFRTDAYMAEVNKFSRGIVSDRNRLYWEDFKQMPSPFPSPEEQTLIARFIDHLDRRVRRYVRAKQRIIDLLNEQKQAIIRRAVTRGLDPGIRLKPSGVDWLGDVPGHWNVYQLGRLARIGNGSTPSRGNPGYWSGGTYPWLNSSCVNRSPITAADQFVTDLALRECHLPKVPAGSVLVAITGQGKTRGTAAIVGIEATINQHIAFVSPAANAVSAPFLQMFLTGAYSQLRAISDDSGSTKGALTCADLKHFKVLVPPLKEQEALLIAVVRDLTALNNTSTQTQREINLVREYHTCLVADVITGKLDVREAARCLPIEGDETEAIDEADAIVDGEDSVDADAVPEEADA